MNTAPQIIDELIQQGVNYFCISPGSRVTPLALGIATHSEAQTKVHFDERGIAFHALGFAKASGKPAAILTTSGTAVGHLLPAIMESSLSYIPLIILTADRPPELRDCSANQTLDQIKIFQDYVRWQIEIPCTDLSDAALKSTIAQAVYRAKRSPAGPVHLNCQFREPFQL